MQTETLSPFYQLEISRENNLDLLTVNVEGSPPLVAQGRDAMNRVAHKAQKDIKDFIGVTAKVVVKATGEIPVPKARPCGWSTIASRTSKRIATPKIAPDEH